MSPWDMQKHRPLLTSLRFLVIVFHMIPWVTKLHTHDSCFRDWFLVAISNHFGYCCCFNLSLVTSCILLAYQGSFVCEIIYFRHNIRNFWWPNSLLSAPVIYAIVVTVQFSCLNLMFLFWLFKNHWLLILTLKLKCIYIFSLDYGSHFAVLLHVS